MTYCRPLLITVLLVVASLGCWSGSAYGELIDRSIRMATDSARPHVFLQNPALVQTEKIWIGYMRSIFERKMEAAAISGDGLRDQRTFTAEHEDHALGLLYPLGGGAVVGASGQFIGYDLKAQSQDQAGEFEETFRKRHGSVSFAVDLTQDVRGGFSYRYAEVRNDVLGSFSVSSSDRSRYLGTMAGYSAGLFFEKERRGLGGSYSSPMRGKASIAGEEKIISESGNVTIDGFFRLSNKMVLGLAGQRWFYKRDDRAKVATSPEDQRNMSLNGLDLEQFLLPTQLIMVGLDVPVNNQLEARFSLSYETGVYLFDGREVPGGRPSVETEQVTPGGRIGAHYQGNGLDVEFGYGYQQRRSAAVHDNIGWFGVRNYEDVTSKVQGFYFMVSMLK